MNWRRLRLDALAFALGLLLLWHVLADLKVISPIFFPSPGRTFGELHGRFADGSIWTPLGQTTLRMLYGWLLACLLGVALGAAIGASSAARAYLGPLLEFIRPLPASAIIPVAILFLGLSNQMSTAVIAFGSIWPVLLASVHGFANVEPRLAEVASALRLSRLATVLKISIPSAMPDILAGARVSLSIALILAIVTEMQASLPGLGQDILLAQRSFRSPALYAGVVMLGAVGFVANTCLLAAERRLLRWRTP
jgi:ABC-type nitrate/sulfonate/bicarbonate transport system permease component